MTNLAFSVVANSFWIIGLAILLAAFSYHYDQAQRRRRPLRVQLRQRSFVGAAWIATTLVAVGLAGTSNAVWEAIIWSIFALISLYNALSTRRTHSRVSEDSHGD